MCTNEASLCNFPSTKVIMTKTKTCTNCIHIFHLSYFFIFFVWVFPNVRRQLLIMKTFGHGTTWQENVRYLAANYFLSPCLCADTSTGMQSTRSQRIYQSVENPTGFGHYDFPERMVYVTPATFLYSVRYTLE